MFVAGGRERQGKGCARSVDLPIDLQVCYREMYSLMFDGETVYIGGHA